MNIGDKIEVTAKSKHHTGQTGTIHSAIDNMYVLIKVDDESYSKAFKSKDKDGKYLQIYHKNIKVLS